METLVGVRYVDFVGNTIELVEVGGNLHGKLLAFGPGEPESTTKAQRVGDTFYISEDARGEEEIACFQAEAAAGNVRIIE